MTGDAATTYTWNARGELTDLTRTGLTASFAYDLAAVRALGDPIVDLATPKPYAAMQSMLNAMEPKGLHRYWKTEFLPHLSSEFLGAFRSSALQVTSPLSQSLVFHLAGALNDRKDDDGAVGNRDARYIGGFSGTWPPGAPSDPHVTWVRNAWERIQPFSTVRCSVSVCPDPA